MRVFICTAGTSIATNKSIDIKAIENRPLYEKDDLEIHLLGLRQQVQEYFSKLDIKRDLDRTSAEIKSLAKMGLEKGDRVYLLVSDTIDGLVCAELNKKYIEKNWDSEVILDQIKGLQPSDSQAFKKNGVKNLLEKVIHLLEEYRYQETYINITAGYKSVVPYITLLGMIHDKSIKYIYEKSSEVITLEKIPVTYDHAIILEVEDKLDRIENETEIRLDVWEKGIPYENRKRYFSLIQESSPGSVTMSAIGLIFYEKFKTDHLPELPKDYTPQEKKRVHLREDHGKDILMAFSKKLVKSPFVKGVVNSLPFNPCQKEPIRKYYENGKIEIVLVDTDQGYGLVIQTTGTDLNQTKHISELIRQKFL